jgi:hypothetical protein
METQNFEDKLIQMTKPEVTNLKHQEILSDAVLKAKEKLIVSWWWICVPLFIICMLIMKSMFMPGTSLISNIQDYAEKEKYQSLFLFIIVPVALIIANILSIRKVFKFYGSPMEKSFIEIVLFNIVIIVFSVFVLAIYLI